MPTNSSLRTLDGVRRLMSSSKNSEDWNNHCILVKEANNGEYPSFWFQEIILTKLY